MGFDHLGNKTDADGPTSFHHQGWLSCRVSQAEVHWSLWCRSEQEGTHWYKQQRVKSLTSQKGSSDGIFVWTKLQHLFHIKCPRCSNISHTHVNYFWNVLTLYSMYMYIHAPHITYNLLLLCTLYMYMYHLCPSSEGAQSQCSILHIFPMYMYRLEPNQK